MTVRQELRDKPDLYTPFWVATTLWFALGVSTNVIAWWEHDPALVRQSSRIAIHKLTASQTIWKYDFSVVASAAAVFYLTGVCVPGAVHVSLRCSSVQSSLVGLISLYGYAMIPAVFAIVS